MWFLSAIFQVVASFSVWDRQTWNSTLLLAGMFTTLQPAASGGVVMWASYFANVLLGAATSVPTSCNSCLWECWYNFLKRLQLTEVICRIWYSNRLIALPRSASDHLVATCRALLRHTCNCFGFDVVTISAPYTTTSIAARIVRNFCSHNWRDYPTNCLFTLSFAGCVMFWSRNALCFL